MRKYCFLVLFSAGCYSSGAMSDASMDDSGVALDGGEADAMVGDAGAGADSETNRETDAGADSSVEVDSGSADSGPADAGPRDPDAGVMASTCADGVRNGDEEAVDCGGSCVPCDASCESACMDRGVHDCFSRAECDDYCGPLIADSNARIWSAFNACLGEELCFRTMDSCIRAHLFPEPVLLDVTLRGSGFDVDDGARVWARIEDPPGWVGLSYEVVASGRFTFHWTLETQPHDMGIAEIYIDRDGDSVCDPAADLPLSTYWDISGPLDRPVITADVIPPERPHAFVCSPAW